MAQKQTIFEFIEDVKALPNVITVERTQISRYLFYALVREYRRQLKLQVKFHTYSKAEMNVVKSAMEEHSFLEPMRVFVLEGFSLEFVSSLAIPVGSYCVAETDNGTLFAPAYTYKTRRDILKLLSTQLGVKLSLRALLGLDWTSCRDYPDFEVVMRKVKLMGWSEKELGESLASSLSGNVLQQMVRGQFVEIFSMLEKYKASWMQNHVIELLGQLAHYRALKQMGYEDDRAARDMDVGWARMKELTEVANLFTQEDINLMAARMVDLDRLMVKNRELGISLYLLNAPVRLNR